MMTISKILPILLYAGTAVLAYPSLLRKDDRNTKQQRARLGGNTTTPAASARALEDDYKEHPYFPDNPFLPPSADDERSPCPGLNTAANHGFINRSGRDIPLEDIRNLGESVYPVTREFLNVPINAAIENGLFDLQEDGVTQTLTLSRLLGVMEHDASLVRQDVFFDPANELDLDLVEKLVGGKDSITFDDMLEFQTDRLLDSLERNPEASFSEDAIFAMAEQATFVLHLGQEPDLCCVKSDVVREWLVDNRLHESYRLDPDFPPVELVTDDASSKVLQRFEHNIERIVTKHNFQQLAKENLNKHIEEETAQGRRDRYRQVLWNFFDNLRGRKGRSHGYGN